ncbi:bacillithiol biosynthesis deacetylase BshB2 [Bacillus sp. FJAT-45037]|uniref:bacillithiol biosynthesis deacetylase BshB2 n=1 Tax=Bacillus sp. FJAT-45037 TaxID=2011007 RepID=UPI000C246394|nr:bacillithiol biosynthesis deacetylase BshB2 [Bacillus sp. FJAT-45037]
MKKERHVLVIFPHPDDEAFGVSGTIAMHASMGTPVTYACLTLGEMGRNLGNPPFATRESLPEIRKKELVKATEAIGVTDLRMAGLRDKTLEFEDDQKMTDLVTDLIDDCQPSLVITFYPEYSVHPDHEATARAVVRAIQQRVKSDRPILHCVAFSNGHEEKIGKADIINQIQPFVKQKMAALKAHISQTAWMIDDLEQMLSAGVDQHEAISFLTEKFWTYDVDQWQD